MYEGLPEFNAGRNDNWQFESVVPGDRAVEFKTRDVKREDKEEEVRDQWVNLIGFDIKWLVVVGRDHEVLKK
jgi:hypothetical protein